jgi:hypothetical protein
MTTRRWLPSTGFAAILVLAFVVATVTSANAAATARRSSY